jgi:RNA polymerase sigma-70 factor, ECF subfamily
MHDPGGGATPDVTELLHAWSEGDESALERLTPLVYSELHRVAHSYMNRERQDHTLQTTALVNEAYMRLVDAGRVRWDSRQHFVAISARLMRRVLVDFARSRSSQKRGSDSPVVGLDGPLNLGAAKSPDLVALDDALNSLAARDPRKAKVIELRFFGGLDVKETAEALGISEASVLRDWRLARAWLSRELRGGPHDG